jgi:RecA/RadA recombinase
MAKSTLSKFQKLSETLDKKVGAKIRLRGFADISHYIDTGNYLLNAQISGSLFGGYPNTRSFCIAGESGSGKTYLCLNAVRNAQKDGYYVIYVDTEGALDSTDFQKFGCNMEQLNYKRIGKISETGLFMNELLKFVDDARKDDPELMVALVVDSVGQLDTNKFLEDLDKGKAKADMGLRAKELRALFRAFTLDFSSMKIPFLMTNHIGSSVDAFAGDGMNGGKGLEYAASGILFLYKGALKEGEGEDRVKTGTIVRSTVKKSRLAKPVNIKFHISFEKGMNKYVGLEEYVSWETCGVVRGKKLTAKEYNKLKPDEQKICHEFTIQELTGKDAKESHEVTYYVKPSTQARNFIIKWTGDEVPTREFFSKKVFSDKVLQELEENIIKPTFKYASYEEIMKAELEELEEMKDFLNEDELEMIQ